MARQDSPTNFSFVHERTEPVHGEPVQGVDLENDTGSFLPQDDSLETPLLPVAVDGSNRGHAASTKVAAKDKGWAIAFKINVVMTVLAAVWFGKMAVDAVANDSLSGAGRRRLQAHGGSGKSFGFCVFGAVHAWHFSDFFMAVCSTAAGPTEIYHSFFLLFFSMRTTLSSFPSSFHPTTACSNIFQHCIRKYKEHLDSNKNIQTILTFPDMRYARVYT